MKNKECKMFVAVFNGIETHFEADPMAQDYQSDSVKGHAIRIVNASKITTKRKNPQPVRVKIDVFGVKDGKMVRSNYTSYDVYPPLERMTNDEFNKEQADSLSEVPPEFHESLSNMAYERGHSEGYESVIGYLKTLVSDLKPSIEAYGKRISK